MCTWLREEEIADHPEDMSALCHHDSSAVHTRSGTTFWAGIDLSPVVRHAILSVVYD